MELFEQIRREYEYGEGTIPACPQPVTTTKPCVVSSTNDWSSGTVSSTRPFGVCIFPLTLQFLSGYLRGTGPVSQAPGKRSLPLECSTNVPPVASYPGE